MTKRKRIILAICIVLSLKAGLTFAGEHYLFSYFKGNGEDGLHLAHSTDGVRWTALNRDRSLLMPTVDKDRLMRDPSIVRGPDRVFHMVWTTGWHDRGIGVAHSKDLIEWSEQKRVGVMDHESGCRNCWAPEISYDEATEQYLIFWASTVEGRFPETADSCDNGLNHRMYYVTTKDFETYSQTRLFFDPGFAVIDSFLVRDGGRYVLVTKDETKNPEPKKNLFVATAPAAEGPYKKVAEPFSPDWVEGPAVLKVGDRWIVYFDEYTRRHYKAMWTRDFESWNDLKTPMVHPAGMRHGTAFAVDAAVAQRLLALKPPALPNGSFEEVQTGDAPSPRYWRTHTYGGQVVFSLTDQGRDGSNCVSIQSAEGADAVWTTTVKVQPNRRYRLSGWIRTKNIAAGTGRGALLNIHELNGVATEPVVGTNNWQLVEKQFDTGERTRITVNALLGGWGESTGMAWYDDLQLEDLGETPPPSIWPAPSGNPIIPDCIADPSITEFDGVFYLTATTDDCPREGFGRWHNGPAVVWKSTDLVNWRFEGHLMPGSNDMLYWAPSRILRRGDRYLLFPTLNKRIRVAAADSPEGPFHLIADSRERPLLDTIDAEVFVDDDGQGYLFSNHRQAWRMNDDLTGVVGEPLTIPTRRSGYSEGPIVFKRQGVYYYLYTQSGHESYHYAYCMSRSSPLGPFETPAVDIIAESDPEQGVFGPGHGTVFSPAGTDDHYFVYLEYGRGGVTRQVCMDRMEFNDDGTIKPVGLTTTGIPSFHRQPAEEGQPAVSTDAPVNLVRGDSVVATASSCRQLIDIRGISDRNRLLRREDYVAKRAIDGSNFTRWLPADKDPKPWFMVDLGEPHSICRTELSLYRPTLGHAYQLEASLEGECWATVAHHPQRRIRSPQVDAMDIRARYLRLKILDGHPGVWEMKVYGGN